MNFNSYLFILVFLPLTVSGYYIIKRISGSVFAERMYLILVSVFFYCFGGILHAALFMAVVLYNFLCFRFMSRMQDSGWKKGILFIGISGNLLWLFYYKYYNFFVGNLNGLLGTDLPIRDMIMPIGISFITFQMIAFLVDGYRGEIKQVKISEYFVFATFFPKLTVGPITKYNTFIERCKAQEVWENLAGGSFLFIMGLGKKVILADTFEKAVSFAFADLGSMGTCNMLLVSFMYTLQIYFDFSGYSDMAIGVGRMFGYELPINFNSPYKAADIAQFWERWHMSLTNFFTRYLYIPMGGSRKGSLRTYRNIMIVFLCSGLWHGADWSFVLWGALHGTAMVVYRIFKEPLSKIRHGIGVLITFLFVDFAWIVFRAGSFARLGQVWKALLRWDGFRIQKGIVDCFSRTDLRFYTGGLVPNVIFMMGFLAVAMIIVFFLPNTQEICAKKIRSSRGMAVLCVLILVVSVMSLSNVTGYIYAMF